VSASLKPRGTERRSVATPDEGIGSRPQTPAARPLQRSDRSRAPLGTRLTRATVAGAGMALLVAAVLINVFLFFSSRALLVEDMRVQARIAGDNSAAALLFRDASTAQETLDALAASTMVHRAVLFDPDGYTVATFLRDGVPPTPPLEGADRELVQHKPLLRAGRLYLSESVRQHGRVIGRVELTVPLAPLRERALNFALITAGAALLGLGLAYLLALRVRRDIDRTEARLDELAFVDPVTGLYNRHAANEHLQGMVDRVRQEGGSFALMLIDLDDFKLINDTLGHAVGDDVLRQMAQRLRSGLRASDLVFRFGGDEFVVVCEGPLQAGACERLGQTALACLQAPLMVDRNEVFMRGSIGLAQCPADGLDARALLKAADTAMYEAKGAGKNTFAVYDAGMGTGSDTRLRTDTELRHAIERDELVLHFQPIVRMADGQVVGVEALVRWQHPQRGLLPPADFIDIAESSGLIVELGGWVLKAACRQLAAWAEQGLGHLSVAVNVSGRQIRRGLLLQQVREALQSTGADAGRLQIEITEHTLVEDLNANLQTLGALRQMGIGVGVDDFGTGLSSLAYLKRLPIDKFKVDRSFVKELPHQAGDVAIVTAVISMARALHLLVVAEGVETESQRDLLTSLGCDQGQGYLYSKPLPAEQLTSLLRPPTVAAAPAEVR